MSSISDIEYLFYTYKKIYKGKNRKGLLTNLRVKLRAEFKSDFT